MSDRLIRFSVEGPVPEVEDGRYAHRLKLVDLAVDVSITTADEITSLVLTALGRSNEATSDASS